MNNLLKIIFNILFFLGMLVLLIMPSNKYSWMQEVDPTFSSLPIDTGSGERAIFTLVLVIIIVAMQMIIAVMAKGRERVVSILLVLVAISVWSVKFAG